MPYTVDLPPYLSDTPRLHTQGYGSNKTISFLWIKLVHFVSILFKVSMHVYVCMPAHNDKYCCHDKLKKMLFINFILKVDVLAT